MPALPLVLALATAAPAVRGVGEPVSPDPLATLVLPFVERHCVACHGGEQPKGKLDLAALVARGADAAWGEVFLWSDVRAKLRADAMPPEGEPRPEAGERHAVLLALDALLDRPGAPSDPGRVTLRRMSRDRYARSVRDLVGVDVDAEDCLPPDEIGYGFAGVGDAQSLSPLFLERALDEAEEIAAEALVDPAAESGAARRFDGAALESSGGVHRDGTRHVLYASGDVHLALTLPRAGDYRLRVAAWGQQAGPDPARMGLSVDGTERERFDVTAADGEARVYELEAHLAGGEHALAAAFLNDYYRPEDPDPRQRDRNLVVEWIEVEGPLDAPVLSPFQREVEERLEEGSLRDVVAWLAGRAWRRPASEADVDGLLALAAPHASSEESLRTVLVALLVSPRFLYGFEADPPRPPGDPAVRDLDGYELAARLATFLWSSLPDERLEDLAASGQLSQDDVQDAEVDRMLRDPRASSLSESFAAQWLQLVNLERITPDPERFPAFDDGLRASMRAEGELFFDAILREDRPIRELLEADFTFVDERLAKLYGIPGVHGARMRRVSVAGAPGVRGGVLGEAGVLAVTSTPTRTSPVLRGKWILETLLDAAPPPPPPGVPTLTEGDAAERSGSLRERLERHRADPTCAACHAGMDPLGFALEDYDALGAWRESEGGRPIDASGVLSDGRSFSGPAELRALLARDPAFLRGLLQKLVVYAVGRGLEPSDAPALDALVARLSGPETTLREMIHGIVRLDLFRRCRAAPPPAAAAPVDAGGARALLPNAPPADGASEVAPSPRPAPASTAPAVLEGRG